MKAYEILKYAYYHALDVWHYESRIAEDEGDEVAKARANMAWEKVEFLRTKLFEIEQAES